ncbi:response regulator [Fervidibacter sacchari]|mgnify:FL=1|uniref:DNA-binding response OmpR family regulator n=1 Tax=Candidatus Fervidibacter sacchari TaxID=1448929 RepID=A0ABT2EI57_9BACT|nr:response regulator [Candidatus Fervidibacter sacchari]MCS3917626.1 DNA-binding response OmpR family regulator [Candidatus Fervidibacter sacchari]WKU15458.1 response regulator [Candidatus Fervidibacter sacchari]
MKRKILVVDDEVAIVRVLRDRLEMEGFEVLTAYDGAQGVEIARKEQPDLIIMDITMPNMDGLTATRLLREQPETAHIPIVMLTARGQESDERAGYQAGAVLYFTKPFSTRQLVREIRRILGESEE